MRKKELAMSERRKISKLVAKRYCKERIGSKRKERYDLPKIPYQRMIECNRIKETTKERLKEFYKSLNPAELKREIIELQN